MVLSLAELSLRAIMNGIKNGTIRHPHLLPPILREWIYDTAFKHGLTNHPNFLALLTSVEFLNGMKSISANACRNNDLEFLGHLATSLATKLPNEKTIGDAITKMNLQLHERSDFRWSIIKDFSAVYGLVVQCPNTKTLTLRVINNDHSMANIKPRYWPLNENRAWIRVMENLTELSLCCWTHVDKCGRPIVKFTRLTTLKLDRCSLTDNQWLELLKSMPFLENLHLFNFRISGHWQQKRLDLILPFPLPHLKLLEIVGDEMVFECNKAFVDNLMGCPNLAQVHLMLDQTSTDEESLVRLANWKIDLKIKIWLFLHGNDPAENAATFDSSSRFKIVRIFHEIMDSFELLIWTLDQQISTGLEDVVGTCSTLTKFSISLPAKDPIPSEIKEMKRVNAALVKFFANSKHALKLKYLRLRGKFDEAVISAVFGSCLNLIGLDIFWCPALRDQHLINWVARGGGKLTDLVVDECENVTSEGIIPILAMSAEGLLRCNRFYLCQDNGGRNLETELRNHCPNVCFGPFP